MSIITNPAHPVHRGLGQPLPRDSITVPIITTQNFDGRHLSNGHGHHSHHALGGSEVVPQPDSSGDGQDDSPEIDIIINNVVCSFGVRCHLNLKRIAMEGAHVEYKRENGVCFHLTLFKNKFLS